MDPIEDLERKRREILNEMLSIRSMKRGTVNEQFLKVPIKGRDEPALRGPYYVLTRSQGGRTVSRRLTSPEMRRQAEADVAAHKKFVALCLEYERLTERLGEIERRDIEGAEKKRPNSPSKRKRK